MQVLFQIHKQDCVSRGSLAGSECLCKPWMSRWSKNVKALMDLNVNWGIYHNVESKLLQGHGNGLPGPPWPCLESSRDCQCSSCWVCVTTSWVLWPLGVLLSTGCKWKMKNNSIQLMKSNELLSCRSDRKTQSDESDSVTWPASTLQLCQAGSLAINHFPVERIEIRAEDHMQLKMKSAV